MESECRCVFLFSCLSITHPEVRRPKVSRFSSVFSFFFFNNYIYIADRFLFVSSSSSVAVLAWRQQVSSSSWFPSPVSWRCCPLTVTWSSSITCLLGLTVYRWVLFFLDLSQRHHGTFFEFGPKHLLFFLAPGPLCFLLPHCFQQGGQECHEVLLQPQASGSYDQIQGLSESSLWNSSVHTDTFETSMLWSQVRSFSGNTDAIVRGNHPET